MIFFPSSKVQQRVVCWENAVVWRTTILLELITKQLESTQICESKSLGRKPGFKPGRRQKTQVKTRVKSKKTRVKIIKILTPGRKPGCKPGFKPRTKSPVNPGLKGTLSKKWPNPMEKIQTIWRYSSGLGLYWSVYNNVYSINSTEHMIPISLSK